MTRIRERNQLLSHRGGRSPIVSAAALLLFFLAAVVPASGVEHLSAALLTRDLGDPRAPGNAKIVLTLPETLARQGAAAQADDFLVYVYPADLPDSEGVSEPFRADGVYLWRRGDKIFLDVRVLPEQNDEGPAVVKVLYAPDGTTLAEGVAEGESRYASELVDVVLAVDVSRSMIYNDPSQRRVTAARTFLEMARQGGGIGRVGLVTFNHRAVVNSPLVPLSQGEKVLATLAKVGADGLTNLDSPLRLGMQELSAVQSERPVIILLTDGRNEGSIYKNTHLECAKAGVRIFTVGLTESADHELLKEMADATGGIYFRAPKDSDLPEIYARLAAELGKRQLLHAEIIRREKGGIEIPVDSSVRRMVAMADAGALVGVSGPGGARLFAGDALAPVQMGRPVPGKWNVNWERAAPDLSLLALFGDTQFFLDTFPPQLRGGKLAVGATLARGVRALAGARVWAEPVPGVTNERLELFDDGRHGDGLADDGVYGTVIDYTGDLDSFDLIVRATGTAWEGDAFVRQATGLTIRSREPPVSAGTARIGGDVDFGVLFPGETGTALAKVELEAPGARELFFDLSWDGEGPEWPDFSSRVLVEPGSRSFEMEMTVPAGARPGDYAGRFTVSDGDGMDDAASARVKVGTVRFDAMDPVDLGVVPPGTFASRVVEVRYDADKKAPVEVGVEGGDDITFTPGANSLDAGPGHFPMEIMVSVPMGKPEGEYQGRAIVMAGPGRVDIPVRWRVKAYAAAAPTGTVKPVEGLPTAPSLLKGDKPLPQLTPEQPSDIWVPEKKTDTPAAVDSPWERSERVLRDRVGERTDEVDAVIPGGKGEFQFPTVTDRTAEGKGGDSIWNAWWIYLLAALLLLLLLLLLLAYILYRLGKSAVARFLLVSAIANLILLAIFIALLGTSLTIAPRTQTSIAVNLVEEEYEPFVELTAAERGMIGSTATAGDSGGGEAAAAGEISFSDAALTGGQTAVEKKAVLPDGIQDGLELAEAHQPSAMPLENDRRETVRRRERRPERDTQPEPMPELPEMAEPPAESGEQAGNHSDVGEVRLNVESPRESTLPVWSEGDREIQPLASDRGALLAEASGAEAVSMDDRVRRVDPRGRRRSHREVNALNPEPRVDIADPARDANEYAASSVEDHRQDDPGVEEIRIATRAVGTDSEGQKPGAFVPPGVSRLSPEQPEELPRGISGEARSEPAAARGGLRKSRGTAGRAGSSRPEPNGGTPGSLARSGEGPQSDGKTGQSPSVGGGDAVGEKRFDALPGGNSGGPQGQPDSNGGSSRAPAGLASAGASPSPFRGGGSERTDFSPRGGPAGRKNGGDSPRRDDRGNGNGDQPNGLSLIPGGNGGDKPEGKSDGRDDRPGRSSKPGTGEGRFDEMARGGGDADGRDRGGADIVGGPGRSVLDADGAGDGLSPVAFERAEGDWRRNDRRARRRGINAAASSVDPNSLLLVVGDFARLPDSAASNLFGVLAERLGGGIEVEERRLSPGDANLADSLLTLMDPAEAARWSDADVDRLAGYLKSGGHLWMDTVRDGEADAFMNRLARASGGRYGPLDASHPLSNDETVDALVIGDKLAAVVTRQNWRSSWRYGDKRNGRTFRFLIRSLNYFLSGDADAGIVLRDEKASDELFVEPVGESMPETLAGRVPGMDGRLWDDFGPDTASSWRMPSWSDPGRISAVSDGQGGRALKMDSRAAVKGRAAVYRTLTPPQNFTRVDRITLDAYYDGAGEASLSMVFTVPGGNGWLDYETRPVRLASGWNRVEFPVAGERLRALGGGGGDTDGLPAADRVGRAGFFLYRNGDSAAVTMLRDIRIHEDE